ncbi:DoxX family protein [Jatrophihabitans telluris]|uniref:DoxX family protein n=1 Tax=Jatrophihabitans telluris TaxID=2038343 RepID=A0ABY4QW40_9ACTN|nr:DoxX family protein [Jatrophihabitans telluris]UQX87261.1 DoxX family protein [Jatrophihabitans telluris]
MTTLDQAPQRTGWRRFSNSWPTVPLRIFLAALFLFAGYAKLTYPGFFDPKASFGFRSAVASAKADSPISSLLTPMIDHPSLFGHVTAFAELAIGLGLLVGLLTRLAALGGIALTVLIVLSVNWNEVKQYTGNGGWFTSVDLVTALALTVFVLGGAGPLSLDGAIGALRRRRAARDDAEPPFTDHDSDRADSRRRLAGGDTPATAAVPLTAGPSGNAGQESPQPSRPAHPVSAPGGAEPDRPADQSTQQLPPARTSPATSRGDSLWREEERGGG